MPTALTPSLEVRDPLLQTHADVLTRDVRSALEALAGFEDDRRALMEARTARRAARARHHERISFLPPTATIGRRALTVQEARDGRFVGSDIPHDLQRQWIQGTGPGAKRDANLQRSIRNVAYALLSGADGWMFDGEDAL